MSNTNNTMHTQTLNALHNAIMESGGKDRPPMLAPGNYVQWKTRIKRYIDTKPNNELIHYCLQNLPYKFKWTEKTISVAEGSSETRIDNDIYSTVDVCLNACEMWKAIERLKQGESINVQDLETNLYWEFGKFTSRDGKSLKSYYSRSQPAATRNRSKAIINSSTPTYDQEPALVAEDDEMSKDDIDDEPEDQELEAHYLYIAQIQKATPDVADNSGPIFDAKPLQKVQNNDDNYNVFAIKSEHPEQPKSVNDIYPFEQDEHNIIIDSLDMSYDREQNDQDDDDLANEREIEDFKTKNKSLESSDNHFKDANNKLSKTNQLMFKDLKKFQAELDRYHDVNYASKVAIDCAKAKGDLMSYKMESKRLFNEYTRKINDLNQTISEMKKELFAHQETISIMSQEKEAHIKFYKTRKDKELDKVIALENKFKVLDDIVYKTGQSVQTMNMLNRNCKTGFAKPEFLKKAQRVNPRMYDIGCYNDNLALMLAPESDETIRLAKESRTKLSDLIRPFDYDQLNNLYDLFVPQREKLPEQHYFSKESKMSHTSTKNEISKESFNKQTTLLEKRMDESIP
ncbi:hypothetical protein Tco_0432172 [Tanacetum coccineum]